MGLGVPYRLAGKNLPISISVTDDGCHLEMAITKCRPFEVKFRNFSCDTWNEPLLITGEDAIASVRIMESA